MPNLKPYLTCDEAILAYAGSYVPAAEIYALPRAEQELRIGVDLYAHIYAQRCREFHQAILFSAADLALQAAWQSARDDLVATMVDELGWNQTWAEAAE